jgi:hypothetical protein
MEPTVSILSKNPEYGGSLDKFLSDCMASHPRKHESHYSSFTNIFLSLQGSEVTNSLSLNYNAKYSEL